MHEAVNGFFGDVSRANGNGFRLDEGVGLELDFTDYCGLLPVRWSLGVPVRGFLMIRFMASSNDIGVPCMCKSRRRIYGSC